MTRVLALNQFLKKNQVKLDTKNLKQLRDHLTCTTALSFNYNA